MSSTTYSRVEYCCDGCGTKDVVELGPDESADDARTERWIEAHRQRGWLSVRAGLSSDGEFDMEYFDLCRKCREKFEDLVGAEISETLTSSPVGSMD